VFVDKNGNIFTPGHWENDDLYKISHSGNGIGAEKIATEVGSPYAVDREGNLFYKNNFGNNWCIAADGTKFQTDIDLEYNFNTPLFPMPQRDGGGLIYIRRERVEGSEMGGFSVKLNLLTANVAEKQAELQLIYGYTDNEYGERWDVHLSARYFGSKTLLHIFERYGYESSSSILIRSDLSTKILEQNIPTDAIYTANHAYWADSGAIYDFNAETEERTVIHSLEPGTLCSNFSYADGLIMFTKTDNTREKRFRCEIRDGVYKEEEITTAESETPEMIDFIRVN
jgi:hypothetical protein